MKILHYFLGFPPAHGGGLFIYVDSLSKWQAKNGHEVILLMPGRYGIVKKGCKVTFLGLKEGRQVYEILNSLPVSIGAGIASPKEFMSPRDKKPFREFLSALRPDVFHLHSLIGLPKELTEAAKEFGIKVVFTTHDYFGLCPKVNFFSYQGEVCSDYTWQKCPLCNQNAPSASRLKLIRNLTLSRSYPFVVSMYRMAKRLTRLVKPGLPCHQGFMEERVANTSNKKFSALQGYYLNILKNIDGFHFNSSIAQAVYVSYLKRFNIYPKGEIIHITHDRVWDRRHTVKYQPLRDGKLSITFIGPLSEYKGFPILLRVLEEIRQEGYTNWVLNVYSSSKVPPERFDSEHIRFWGTYKLSDLENVFAKASLVVLPSRWYETFGFTGLEALSFGIPCLVAKNVGFADLIEPGKTGFIYDGSEESLLAELKRILIDPSILQEIHQNIQRTDYNFNFHLHGMNIIAFYENVKNPT
jgi:glycosyltransferase involved in cell wall biosynthesis